jgi:hypothetical protein
MATADSDDRIATRERRRLAVGGVHAFDAPSPCRLKRVQPVGAVEDLAWTEALVLQAKSAGTAEVTCGNDTILLEIASPTRLDIELIDGGDPASMAVGKRLKVRARPFGPDGRELEIGKFSVLEWKHSDNLETANDRSAAEFGFSDTAFGTQTFRAKAVGSGSVSAAIGGANGTLEVVVK